MNSDTLPWRMEEVACDFCGTTETKPLYSATDFRYGSPGVYRIVRCENCGLVYLNPRPCVADLLQLYWGRYQPHRRVNSAEPSSNSTEMAQAGQDRQPTHGTSRSLKQRIKLELSSAYYGPSAAASRNAFYHVGMLPFQVYARAFGHILYPFPLTRAYALDVGCGSGRMLKALQSQGWEVFGLEPSRKAAMRAHALVGGGIVVGTLPGACFKAGSFEFVTLSHVLEHAASPGAMLGQVHEMMKVGGHLLVVVPNFGSVERMIAGASWSHLEPPRHLYHFDTAMLRKYLERSGFQVGSFVRFSETWALQQSLRWRFFRDPRLHDYKPLPSALVRTAAFMLSLGGRGNILVAYCRKPHV